MKSQQRQKQQKVAFFIPSLRGGGAERMIVHLANGFVNVGVRTELIVAQREGVYFKDVDVRARVININKPRILLTLVPLVKYIHKEKPDVLIVTLDHASIIAVCANFFAGNKTKIVIRVANTLSASLKGTKGVKRILRKYGSMFFYRFAHAIVGNSSGSADDLAKTLHIDRERVHVIHNPTVTPRLKEKSKEMISHPWLLHKDIPVVLAVGRLHEQKDYPTLLRAISLANKKRSVRLLVLGDEINTAGHQRKRLEVLAKELGIQTHVEFHGFVDNPYAYMAHADVYVLSSRWEGLPNTLIEAMAVGTPVVSTDCPSGPSEILEGGKYGTLVPVGDHEALADAIQETIANPIDSSKLQQRAQHFNAESATAEYLSLVASLMSHD